MTALVRSRYLDLPALAALERMRFTTKHRVEGGASGRHRSRRHGGAGEFVDFREYGPGEDLRRLDWKVFARTGKSFLRLHQDETNLQCVLAVDVSGSMEFRGRKSTSPTKLNYVQYLATALSHVIVQGHDQVGLAVLESSLRKFLPPRGTGSHVALLQEEIEKLSGKPTTRMAAGLRTLFEQSRGRGVLLLFSDFLMDDLEDTFAAVRMFRHRGWEAVVLHVVHPEEERLPDGAAYKFEGLENDGDISCSPGEIATLYERRFADHLAMVRKLTLAAGGDYRFVSTTTSYLQTLSGFLIERSG